MQLTGEPLSLTQIADVAITRARVEIAASAHGRIHASRRVIDEITEGDSVVYGVNTGFGKLADVTSRGRSAEAAA
jgi:histidine ammonia-lyase